MPAGTTESGDKAGRAYRSVLRAKAAADTRANILTAALGLFVERGYGKVTIGDIADRAGVAMPTVYASTGGKSAILSTIINEAVRDPIVEDTLAAVRRCREPDDVIRLLAHGTRVDNQRYHDVIQVMKTAAAIDDSVAAIVIQSDREYLRALSYIARRLHEMHALRAGLTVRHATDILWFYFGHDPWQLLVFDRHWSWDDTEHWLAEHAALALINRR
jgi:AcrR family transcriptional regulator